MRRLYDAPSVGTRAVWHHGGIICRYPIISKLKDRLSQTRVSRFVADGNRLAWVSSTDAQEDRGIPMLTTYHHILRDEEHPFRRPLPTSVRAFGNQMTWLRDRGYLR